MTNLTHVAKKLTFTANEIKYFYFNRPLDTNAMTTKLTDSGSTITLDQVFTSVFINNISDFNCYFTFLEGMTPSESAVDGMQVALSKDAANFETKGVYMIGLKLLGAGSIYLVLS